MSEKWRHSKSSGRPHYPLLTAEQRRSGDAIYTRLMYRGKLHGLSGGAHHIILALAYDHSSHAEPGLSPKTLAHQAGLGIATVFAAIEDLWVNRKLIRRRGGGGTRAHLYTLAPSCFRNTERNESEERALTSEIARACARSSITRHTRKRAQNSLALENPSAPYNKDRAAAHAPAPAEFAAAVNPAAAAEALRKLGFDDLIVARLSVHPNCSIDQIRNAIARANYARPVNRLGYIRRAIEENWPGLQTPEQRRRETMPEHRQEELAMGDERKAVIDAREKMIRQAVADIPGDRFEQLCDEVIDTEPDETTRMLLVRLRPKARTSAYWVERIFRAAGIDPQAEPQVALAGEGQVLA